MLAKQDRRRFLQLACTAAGSVGLGTVMSGCGGEDGATAAKGPVAAGNAKDFKSGDLRAVGGRPVAVGRDDTGFYAMTTICTHQQCDISASGSVRTTGFSCSCHGSTFDRNGKRTGGPASADLEHYKVEIAADGAITVQAGTMVGADARVAAPS